MKQTPLYEEHKKLGAKMVPFGGWEMPVQYSGVLEEHRAVREKAGLFDVCHMGEFHISGPDAFSFLQQLTANDVSLLKNGGAQYSMLCNEQGGVVDDILVYRKTAEDFLMVVNASNIDKDWAWVSGHKTGNVQLKNASEETALLALQGPRAAKILQKLSTVNLATVQTFHFFTEKISSLGECCIARTGYTGEDGFEIFCAPQAAAALWRKLLEIGETEGLQPVGLGARDTLRLEARLSLYGHEITDEINPLEAGLSWVVKLDKPDFIGKKALVAIREKGFPRKLVGFILRDKGIARDHYPIVWNGEPVGHVTSGVYSPTLEESIGLGYVPTAVSNIGDKFHIDIRNNLREAEVVKTPFYKRKV